MTPVEFYKDYKGEAPFEMGGQKWVYCWGKYPNGKTDIAVYSYANDLAYDYNDFRTAFNLSEGYKQPQMFMDINETLGAETAPVDTNEFQDDPTIGELIGQTSQQVGDETDAMINAHDQDLAGQDAVNSQYDINEDGFDQYGNPHYPGGQEPDIEYYGEHDGVQYFQDQYNQIYTKDAAGNFVKYDEPLHEDFAPEAKEFMGGEKLQTAGGDNGLAGKVENGDGPKTPEAKEIASLLDRMKELTKIMTNKPDLQWDDRGEALTDKPKEVDPSDVVRSEKGTGAPSIKSETPALRPNTPTSSTPKSDKKTDDKAPAQKKGNPFAKKDETPSAEKQEKKDDKEKEGVEEATSHHMGMKRRNIAHNQNDPNRVDETEEDEVSEETAGLSDEEILESENTEFMYEAMVKYKNDPGKFMKFKRKMDDLNQERRLSEAISKMRRRF